jgi:hypothetical protein
MSDTFEPESLQVTHKHRRDSASMRRDDAYISLFKALAGGLPSDHSQSGRRSDVIDHSSTSRLGLPSISGAGE